MPNPGRPSPDPNERVTCWAHDVANAECGGPHRWVRTDRGMELLKPGQKPEGTPRPGQGDALDALARIAADRPLARNPRAVGDPND